MTSIFTELAFLKTKKSEDGDQNFIKKDQSTEEEKNFSNAKEDSQTKDAIDKLKGYFFPKNNQQRNLDREVGGLEAEEEKEKENSSEDVRYDKSEEVDKINVFNSTGLRSVIWKKKREKLELAKDAIEGATMAKKRRTNEPQNESHLERLKNLKQDRSHQGNQNGNGGGVRGF